MKTCLTCGGVKEDSSFRKHRNSCKSCCRKAGRKYESPDKKKDRRLRLSYNITLEDYQKMYEEQRGQCYLCPSESKLFVDHCHTTGEVRGLLCNNCNLMLGHAKDSPAVLRLAASYLERHDRNNRSTPN